MPGSSARSPGAHRLLPGRRHPSGSGLNPPNPLKQIPIFASGDKREEGSGDQKRFLSALKRMCVKLKPADPDMCCDVKS